MGMSEFSLFGQTFPLRSGPHCRVMSHMFVFTFLFSLRRLDLSLTWLWTFQPLFSSLCARTRTRAWVTLPLLVVSSYNVNNAVESPVTGVQI